MDAHFFRRLATELATELKGARIERFFAPEPELTTIVCYASGLKRSLLLQAGRRFPLLLLSNEKPRNPDTPSAHAMWLRKHAAGARLGEMIADWPARAMAFALSGGTPRWLVIDLRHGVTVVSTLPEGFGEEPQWPDPGAFDSILGSPDVWEQYPQFTPLLRETLKALAAADPMDAQALLVDLEYGPGDCTSEVYLYGEGTDAPVFSVWPLPLLQRKERDERVCATALQAMTLGGTPLLFGTLAQQSVRRDDAPLKAALKRTRKTLAKLDDEEARLLRMIAGQEEALALQGQLWQLGADSRLDRASVLFADGSEREVALDPLRTVRENMEQLFKQAARGKRGIAMLRARRDEIRQQMDRLEQGDYAAVPVRQQRMQAGVQKKQKKAPHGAPDDDKLFHRFVSDDGFLMLRGRNAKGNHTILDKAMPHDLWFHAEDGPSAHLILRLQFPEQEVPGRTLLQAAELVGLRSWQKDGGQAQVMYTFVRYVRKVKGANVGAVHVARREGSLLTDLDVQTEERLAMRVDV